MINTGGDHEITKTITLSLFGTIIFTSAALAQEDRGYFSASGGLASLHSSSNAGELTSAFTTGAGTTIPGGTVLGSGTSLSWDTMFKNGYNIGIAAGYSYGNGFRGEAEVRYIRNSISSHSGVAVGGGAIGTEDAGVLITGSGNLGANVSKIVADGQGSNGTLAFMLNGYYDFMADEQFSPYVGVGVGYADTNIEFSPSAVAIADAGNGGFAYQGIVGATYNITENMGIFAEYRYFARDKVNLELTLLPGSLEVENVVHLFNVGYRINF